MAESRDSVDRSGACALISSQRTKEAADVVDKQLGLFQGGEMSAAGHLSPALNVEETCGPLPWRIRDVFREHGERRWHVGRPDPLPECLDGPRQRTGVNEIGVRQER